MITLEQIKSLHQEVMFTQEVMEASLPVSSAQSLDDQANALFDFGTNVIAMTLAKLSKYVSEIPNAQQMSDMILEDVLVGFANMLDNE